MHEVEMKRIDEVDEAVNSAIAKENLNLKIKFSHHEGHLVISFTPEARNLKLTYKEARDLARRIVKETL